MIIISILIVGRRLRCMINTLRATNFNEKLIVNHYTRHCIITI